MTAIHVAFSGKTNKDQPEKSNKNYIEKNIFQQLMV
jgi:hypothetical protein